jgi:hypothetical protein
LPAGPACSGAVSHPRAVPLIVSGAGIGDGEVNSSTVETTSIAPTIARLVGLNSNALHAVRIEHTRALPLDG